MTLDDALARLRSARSKLERLGVRRAALFGSLARGQAGPDSDVDVFVEIDPKAPVGVWELGAIYHVVREYIGPEADVAERPSLKAPVREEAERDAVYAF